MFIENIQAIKNTFLEYKGTGCYLILFFISMIYIFLKEKDRRIRSFFLIFPILVLFVTLNPIFNKIVSPIFKSSIYWRLYWLIPLTIEIAYASVLLIKEENNKYKEIIAVFGICFIIIASGKFTYTKENFFKTGNWYKLPDESVQVTNLLSSDSEEYKKALVPETLVAYIRQIDSTIELAYKREPYSYENNKFILAMNKGDSHQIADLAKENDCNYLVLKKEIPLTLEMKYLGFSLLDMTENYAIYKLSE